MALPSKPVLTQPYRWAPMGSITPQGWLQQQMQHDVQHGFVGHLDQLVPELFAHDDIYGKDRRTLADKSKDVGAIAQDEDWEVQYLWWNSETQSNWWDGYVRHALLVGSDEQKQKVHDYVQHMLATQDEDGYIGIYGKDLRFQATGENGELWAQASLLRVLLGYYELTQNHDVLVAVQKAVETTMQAWPVGGSQPFAVKESYAGVGHGLVFTDVLDQLYQHTGEQRYLDYAAFLFNDYGQHELSEADIQPRNLLNPEFAYQGHAVHTWEHLRPLLTACASGETPELNAALQAYLTRLADYLTPSGAPIGDEFILGKKADSTFVGYEYCSLQELLDSLTQLIQKSGDLHWGDLVEKLYFNAAQGARHPDGMGIAYLKTDNSYSMTGDAGCHQQGYSVHTVQTRYKYSPTHQEAAVCCVPNAGRISPYYLKAMWMKDQDGLVKVLYGPSSFNTRINGAEITLHETTTYPGQLSTQFSIETDQSVGFNIRCRLPSWATSVKVEGAHVTLAEGYFTLEKYWQNGDSVRIEFVTEVQTQQDRQGEAFFSYGPLVYALPIHAEELLDKTLAVAPFAERCYQTEAPWQPVRLEQGAALQLGSSQACALVPWFTTQVLNLPHRETTHELRPMAGTILRQVTFAY